MANPDPGHTPASTGPGLPEQGDAEARAPLPDRAPIGPDWAGAVSRRPAFSGRQVVWAGVVCGSGGLMVGLFLRAVVARSTVQLPSYALFWLVVVLAAMGGLGGMAVEAVRQLQCSNPDPEYHPFQQQHRRLAEERQQRRRAAARR